MGEGTRLVIAEGAADPAADIDGAEWSFRMRNAGDAHLQQSRNDKRLEPHNFPPECFGRIISARAGVAQPTVV
jgi:hypothetical protein